MQIITDAAALDAVADPSLCPILEQYRDMLDLAQILIIEPGDTLEALHQARGRHFERWEFILQHSDGWYEAVFVISDFGEGHVVLIPETAGTDIDLLHLCRASAVPAERPVAETD